MPRADGDIARRTFDAIASIDGAKSLGELERIAGAEFRNLGFDLVLGVRVLRGAHEQKLQMLFGEVGHRWVGHYQSRGYASTCPVAAAAGARPVYWRDIKRQPLTSRQARMFDELRDFRLNEGFIVAVDKGPGVTAAVSMAGERVEVDDPALRTATHFLSVHFGLAGLDLISPAAEQVRPRLSRRQLECLRWVREGKSSTDIGEILSLSARTVDEHLAAAARELGVSTRVQAVLEAVRLGLLQF